MDWNTHEEDVWFDFRGSNPHQLEPGRYYRGTVDGYADFGVFVELGSGVTGLLHRSELDRRLESLDWEPGDEVFVQVTGVRDNGDVDLSWSIRQAPGEFRGARVHDPGGEADGDPIEAEEGDDEGPTVTRTPAPGGGRSADAGDDGGAAAAAGGGAVDRGTASDDADRGADTAARTDAETDADTRGDTDSDAGTDAATDAGAAGPEAGDEAVDRAPARPTTERERTAVGELSELVGDAVRLEGKVIDVRQTGGPTVFEVRDETGVVECAAFVEAGVRAYPDVEEGDAVRLDGEVELRREELQVETEALEALEGEAAAAVRRRLAEALTERARPDEVRPLAGDPAVEAVAGDLGDAAAEIRRAVFDSRPVVVGHAATADGYVAGAAVERAVLPLIREEHARADAEYHFFDRRPLEDAVYGMDDATNDVTRMLQDRDRHGEKLPLVVLVGVGSTDASADGLGLLGVYDATRVVVDAAPADDSVAEETEVLVDPTGGEADAGDLTAAALAGTLAAAVNADVREDLAHLPAVSYWEETPERYADLAGEAGYGADRAARLREAVALEAYYQSYEDKRELITDILFGETDSELAGDVEGDLADHVSQQFRDRIERELEVAEANLDTHETGGVGFAVLDAEAYTHRFDFPPTALLADALHRRVRGDPPFVTVVTGEDDLYLRATDELDLRAVADRAGELAPEAGVTAMGIREGRIEYLSGERDAVRDAVVAAVVESLG